MSIKDINPPAQEPLDLAYAKAFLRVDSHDQDALIADMIVAARVRVEQLIRAALITRRQIYTTDALSDSGLFINHGPVAAVHSVKVIDAEGASFELFPADYIVNLRSIPACVRLRSPLRWSQYGTGAVQAEIEIDAGYGSAASDVPMPLRQAMLLLLAQSFEHRGQEVSPPVPMMVDALLMPYRSLKL